LTTTDASDLNVFSILYNSTNGPNWKTQPDLNDPCSTTSLVSCNVNSQIIALYLSGNGLSGTIPIELSQLPAIQSLQLSENSLSGTIPTQLGSLSTLQNLNLRSNSLTGNIPTQFGQLTSLTTLFLSSTQLSGPVPTQLHISGLVNLALSNTGLCPLNNYTNFATNTDYPYGGLCQCQPSSCPALRTCIASTTSFTCTCLPGYYGANCTACHCGHGKCSDGIAGNGSCVCNTGWKLEGGSCSACAPKFYGPDCLKCISCGKGNCTDGITGDGSCHCSKGWAVNDTGVCGTCDTGFSGDTCAATLPTLPTYAIGLIYAAILLIVLTAVGYYVYRELVKHKIQFQRVPDSEKAAEMAEMAEKQKEKENSIEQDKQQQQDFKEDPSLENSESEKDKSVLQVNL